MPNAIIFNGAAMASANKRLVVLPRIADVTIILCTCSPIHTQALVLCACNADDSGPHIVNTYGK